MPPETVDKSAAIRRRNILNSQGSCRQAGYDPPEIGYEKNIECPARGSSKLAVQNLKFDVN
jgi:hypothetical protein